MVRKRKIPNIDYILEMVTEFVNNENDLNAELNIKLDLVHEFSSRWTAMNREDPYLADEISCCIIEDAFLNNVDKDVKTLRAAMKVALDDIINPPDIL
jgi:hypothetical protein